MRSSDLSRNIFIKHSKNGGFGLVETLVGISVFILISVAAYGGFIKVLGGVQVLRIKNTATSLANEQIEIIRNLPYDDVGIVGGIPAGKIVRNQQFVRGGMTFDVNTSVRSMDDPFDGQIGEIPNDLSPADYKLAELAISCASCHFEEELKYYARIAPIALETAGNNGALFVQVFDASGQPVVGADVHIQNNQGTSTINIDETTNNEGMFQIVDAPPGVEAYEVTVSNGDNYSTDRTYTIGSPENPVPNKPHANVVAGQVTQISFAIDELSNLDIYTLDNDCNEISNVDFDMRGSKTIGLNLYKFNEALQTSSGGYLNLDDVEWDNYFLTITDLAYDLAGSSPLLPLSVNPGADQSVDLILAGKDPNALLVKVIDGETGLPVSGATVSIDGGSGDAELITGRGFLDQTDWSGGQGQEYFTNESRYDSSSNIDYAGTAGQITLSEFSGSYSSTGVLESSIFDVGTAVNFGNIFWNPIDQPALAGADSVRVQIASNLEVAATSTWDFIGPDGTDSTFYTSPGEAIAVDNSGDRYLKYKIFLETDDTSVTPIISDLSFTFTTDCSPPGQVFFTGLSDGSYDITVDHDDYSQYVESGFVVSDDWSEHEIILTP